MTSSPPTFAPHLRVSAIGSLGVPEVDRFSYGLNLAPPTSWVLGGEPITDAILAAAASSFLPDIRDSIVAFHGRAASKIGTYCVLDTVKFAAIHQDGSYGGTNPVVFQVNQQGGGGNMGGSLPQSAVAVTLDTGHRGASYRGRFFIPYPSVDTSGAQGFHIPQGVAEGIRDSARTLLNDINDAPGLDWFLSTRVVIASTKGFNTPVTSLRVGRVVDTIRSRRNKIPELYTDPVTIT